MENNTQYPLVTIVAVCYNHAAFVVETLDSIIHQTYQNIELVILDAFSSDNSVQIIEEWIEKNQVKCEFIKQTKKHTVCENFNRGLRNTNGEYFQCISCDDVMDKQKIEIQVSQLQSSENIGIVFSNAIVIDEQSKPTGKLYISEKVNSIFTNNIHIKKEIYSNNNIPAPSVLIKRKVWDTVGSYDENLLYEDWDYWLRIAQSNWEFFYDQKSWVYYRKLSNSHWSKKDYHMLIGTFKIFRKHNLFIHSKAILRYYDYYQTIAGKDKFKFIQYLISKIEFRQFIIYLNFIIFKGNRSIINKLYKTLYLNPQLN